MVASWRLLIRRPRVLRLALVSLAVAGLFGLAGCGSSSSSSSSSGTTASASSSSTAAKDLGLLQAGTLTVGMNLQFKPEMYLLNGQPAGYDVDLVN